MQGEIMNSDRFNTPFQDCIHTFDRTVSSYDPFPQIRNEGLKLSEEMRKQLIDDGRAYLGKPYTPISARDFMQFVRTGDRQTYEEKYFSRRHKLCALVTAALATDDPGFIDGIIDGIYCICEETAWVLPAHNTYIRDTPQHILPDPARPVLDLFACETASLLSMTYYLLKDKLDTISPLICDHILEMIRERLVKPYLNDHFWWMGNKDEPMCNWTPWCTQNVLLSVFLLPFGNDIRIKVISQAAYSLDCFLKDYGEDGCCDEGAQYYRHAGLCLYHCIDILNSVTDGAFCRIAATDKIRNIASYIVNVHAAGDYYINFSDCSAKAGRMGIREYLFGKTCDLEVLMRASADDFYHDYHSGNLFTDESMRLNLYCRSLTIMFCDEILKYHEERSRDPHYTVPDIYYPSVGVMVARTPHFILAAKAGDNADNHNHNDTGSFILYLDEKPLFVDVGVETYSRKTFSPDRYDIWTMQSGYHNLPTISGLDQMAGDQYRATRVECDLQDDEKSISMYIEKAYPLSDKLKDVTYLRRISLCASAETFTLTDTTNCDDVILNFITYEPPENEGSANTYRIGNAIVTINGASIVSKETLPITDPHLALAWDHDLFRTRFSMNAKTFIMQVRPIS